MGETPNLPPFLTKDYPTNTASDGTLGYPRDEVMDLVTMLEGLGPDKGDEIIAILAG